MTFSESSPAPLSLKVGVSLQGGIKCIESPTHQIAIQRLSPANEVCQDAMVELSGQTTDMDRDFVLNISPDEPHQPRMYSEKAEDGSTAVMIHLVPSFKLDEQKTELIFVLDRSGSMTGGSIKKAKEALQLFLRSMPADCYFNIVGFGSGFKFLFPTSVKYDDKSLKKAIEHAKNLDADLGGTEILRPLQAIYGQPQIPGYLRQLFVLTDGEVWNTEGVLGIAQANAGKARVFALGIGDGASHHLVEGIAKAGGGTSAFVTYNENIDKKVLNQLKNGLQPSLTDIELEWEGLGMLPVVATDEDSIWNKQSPKRIPPVYDGSQMVVFGMFKDGCPTSVKIKAQSPDGPLALPLEYSSDNDVDRKGMLHRLAAIKLVRELELEIAALDYEHNPDDDEDVDDAKERLKNEIVEIACKNGISSSFTSFVAIDEKDDKASSENWVMETRNVPSQVAHGWGGGAGATVVGSKKRMACPASYSKRRKAKAPAASRKRKAAPASCSKRRKAKVPSASKKRKTVPAASSKKRKAKPPTTSAKKRKTTASASKSKSKSKQRASSKKSKGAAKGSKKSQKKVTLAQPTRKSARLAAKATPAAAVSSDEDMDVDASDDEMTPIMQVIELQSFDGSYTLTVKFAATVAGKTLQQAKNAATKHNLSENIFATALAIAYFVNKKSGEKDKWELIVKKARKWLEKSLSDKKQVDAALAAGKAFIEA